MPTLPRVSGRPDASTAVIAAVGFLGSLLVARASYVVGTLPGHHLDRAVATGPWRWPYEVGVGLLVLAWLALGRVVLDRSLPDGNRRVWWTAAATALPLLAAAPLTSQDVWAYLGQGNVAAHGLDPYTVGPSAAPGPLADSVAREWLGSPSPYGPLWLSICRLVVHVAGPHPWVGMFLLRLVAVAGLAATGIALTLLTRAAGGRPEVALWVALTGPFPFLMLVGAVHNDAVMLALLLGGVAMSATRRSRWRAVLLGAVLVGLAASIKVIALVALPFLPLFWFRYADPTRTVTPGPSPSLRRWVTTGALAVATGIATLLALGVVTGLGIGWVHHVGDGSVGVRWLSIPQQVGNVLHLLAPAHVADESRDRYPLVHHIGLVFLAASLAVVTLTARRRPPLSTLTWVMLLLVVSSAAPRIWYLLWPLVFLAALVAADLGSHRLLVPVAAGSATLALWFPPSVRPQGPEWVMVVLFVPLMAVAAVTLRPAPGPEPVPDSPAPPPDRWTDPT